MSEYSSLPVVLYNYSKAKKFTEKKEETTLMAMQKYSKKFLSKPADKVAKFMDDEENKAIINPIVLGLTKSEAGSVNFVKTNDISQTQFIEGYEIIRVKVAANARDLSKQEYKNTFSFKVNKKDTPEDVYANYVAVDEKIKQMVDDMNKVTYLDKTTVKEITLKYKSLFDKDGSYFISINMRKEKDGNEKYVSSGYPSNNLLDETRKKKNPATKKLESVPFAKNLTYENKLHLLFGTDTIVNGTTKYTWSLSKNTLALKVNMVGDIGLVSCAPDNNMLSKVEEKYGKIDYTVVNDEDEESDEVKQTTENQDDENQDDENITEDIQASAKRIESMLQ